MRERERAGEDSGGCGELQLKWRDRGAEWGLVLSLCRGPLPVSGLGGMETEAGDCTFSGPRVKAAVPPDQASRGGPAAHPATRPHAALKGNRDPQFALPFHTS